MARVALQFQIPRNFLLRGNPARNREAIFIQRTYIILATALDPALTSQSVFSMISAPIPIGHAKYMLLCHGRSIANSVRHSAKFKFIMYTNPPFETR
jgi:hypothetical protein